MKRFFLKGSVFVFSVMALTCCNQAQKHRVTKNFSHLNLEGSDFSGQRLIEANFSNSILNKVNFSDALLTGANFEGASMIECDLRSAIIDHVNFKDADLSKSNMRSSDAARSNFEGASLIEVEIKDANLMGVTGLSNETLFDFKKRGAKTD